MPLSAADPEARRLTAAPALTLGEGPVVDPDAGLLYFLDIVGLAVFRVSLDRLDDPHAYERRTLPDEPGLVVPECSGPDTVLLGLPDGLYRFVWSSGELTRLCSLPESAAPVRINDGACDTDGRLWFGTMNRGPGEPAGMLYRFDGRSLVCVDGPIACWNGIDWSPDGRVMYATDTLGRAVRGYSMTGEADVPEEAVRVAVPGGAAPGLPDGLVVDAVGGVWSALWDAGRVVRFSIEEGTATEDRTVRIAGSRPTAAAFLPDGSMVITSAADDAGPGGLSLLSAAELGGVSGRPRHCFGPRGGRAGATGVS